MNYIQIISSAAKEIIIYVKDQINSLSILTGVNESSLTDSTDIKQTLRVIAKKDTLKSISSLSGFNLKDSLTDFSYQNPKETIVLNNLLSSTNTDIKGVSSLNVNAITIVDQNSVAVSTMVLVSASNTEVFGTVAVFSGITSILDEKSYTLCSITSGFNTESLGLSSNEKGITRVPVEDVFPVTSLSGFNTESLGLSSNEKGITRVPVENIYYDLPLSGFNTENLSLSSNEKGITRVPVEDVFPVTSLSGYNVLFSNLSSLNQEMSCRDFQFVESGFPVASLSGIVSLSANFLVKPIRYSDTDADIYITTIESLEGSLEIGIKNSITEFITELKKKGLWGSITDCLILAGARTLNGALIPLKGTVPTSSGFNSSNYNRKYLKGNGSGFLNLNRINNNYSATNHHVAIHKTTSTAGSQYIFGDGSGTTSSFINLFSTGISQHRNTGTFTPTSPSEANGFLGLSRSSSANYQLRYNSNTQTATRPMFVGTDKPLFLFKAGSTGTPSTAGISFYSQGTSLDLSVYQPIVDRFVYHLNAYTT